MSTFGQLLRQYRRQSSDPMRGGMLTQARLGELLGDELGHTGYSGAAVSDWERDKSKIHADDRHLLVALVSILHRCGGITTISAANAFLASGNYRSFDDAELAQFSPDQPSETVPEMGMPDAPPSPSSTHKIEHSTHRRKQLILLDKVEQFWAKDVLEKTVGSARLIDIQQERCDTAVNQPWQEVVNTAVATATTQSIAQTFAATDRALLILGTPGAGKTTLLITLAQALITKARTDEQAPIPVILNLASWAEKRPSLDKWILEELTAKYQIPRGTGHHWLEQDALIYLLDGLDEVAQQHQTDCIEAINQFRVEHGLAGMVVCSRIEPYDHLDTQLNLSGAIRLQPLNEDQIVAYLTAVGISVEQIDDAVAQDAALREIAQSPLMLRVMSEVALQGTAVPIQDVPDTRQQLFDVYVNQMLTRRGPLTHSAAQTKQWLAWLARKMKAHNQALFLLEQIQPSWLPTRRLQRAFVLTSRLIDGFSLAVVIWLFWLIVRLSPVGINSLWSDEITNALPLALIPASFIIFLTIFLILGLIAGLVDLFFYERRAAQGDQFLPSAKDDILQTAGVVIVTTLASFLLVGLFRSPFMALAVTLFTGVSFALTTYLIHGYSYRSDIRTVEILSWSWQGAMAGIVVGLIISAVFEFIEYQIVGPNPVFATPINLTLLCILLGGLRGNRLPTTNTPRQGIRLSSRSALAAASIFAIIISLTTAVTFANPFFGALAGVLAAWVAGTLYGAGSVVNHYWLLFWLKRLGRVPSHYTEFLDETANRVILNKVGGGYMFIHRLLQEHFAEMNGRSPQE